MFRYFLGINSKVRVTSCQQLRTQIRNYFKPSQKDAFFDVEGVVNKDVLLFRYDDSGLVFRKNMLGLIMLPVWLQMGQLAYSLKLKLMPAKENVAEKENLNWRMNMILQGSVGIGVAYLLFGAGLSFYWITRTMNTVRRLVLRKGGKYISIQTYGITGGPGKVMNIPVVHCSGVQQPFTKTDRFFLKVRDHSFRYQMNLEEGVICNKPLFDRTVGLGRTI